MLVKCAQASGSHLWNISRLATVFNCPFLLGCGTHRLILTHDVLRGGLKGGCFPYGCLGDGNMVEMDWDAGLVLFLFAEGSDSQVPVLAHDVPQWPLGRWFLGSEVRWWRRSRAALAPETRDPELAVEQPDGRKPEVLQNVVWLALVVSIPLPGITSVLPTRLPDRQG